MGQLYKTVTDAFTSDVSVYSNAGLSGGSATHLVTAYNVSDNFGSADKILSYSGQKRLDLTRGVKMVAEVQTSMPATVTIDGVVVENVTPNIVNMEMWCDQVATDSLARAFEKSLAGKVRNKYRGKNDGTWAPNAPGWKQYKQRYGFDTRVMHQHDPYGQNRFGGKPLADTVSNFGDKMRVSRIRKDLYSVEGLTEEFADNPYVWLHETGYTTNNGHPVPARPFIAPAMQEAIAQAMRAVLARSPWEAQKAGLVKPINYSIGLPSSYWEYNTQTALSMERFLMMLWYFLPQVQEYQYLAYMHDVIGYMSGHFISFDTIKNFASALMLGKVGQMTGIPLTGKLARRSARKTLWGTQTISITGGS